MKKHKTFNDFETLSTYNYVGSEKFKSTEKNNNKTNKNIDKETTCESSFSQILVLSPNSIEDINRVICCIKNKSPVIVDLTYRKEALTQKVLNYLNGAVFALNGNINKLMQNVYLILPQNINVNLN